MLRKLRVGKGLQSGGHLLLKIFSQVVRQEEIVDSALIRQHVSVVVPDRRILMVLDLVPVSMSRGV